MDKPKSLRYEVLDTMEVYYHIGKRACRSVIWQVDHKLDSYLPLSPTVEKLMRQMVFEEINEQLRGI